MRTKTCLTFSTYFASACISHGCFISSITGFGVGLFIYLFIFLFGCDGSYLWHVGSSSLMRDQTQAPCIGSTEFYSLAHQGSPNYTVFKLQRAFLVAQPKESAFKAGDLGSILGWEDPLDRGKAIYSSILAQRIPWTV